MSRSESISNWQTPSETISARGICWRRCGPPKSLRVNGKSCGCDAIEGKDSLGREVCPDFGIDITQVMDTKRAMLSAHASQRQWLLKHHGMDEYLDAMQDWGAQQGRRYGVAYAEGFRQHRGHSYPQDNILAQLLGSLT